MTKPIYTELENGIIQRDNLDGSITFIPKDEGNADYQEYLAVNEAKAK